MWLVFDIMFSLVPAIIIIFVVIGVIRNAKLQKKVKDSDEFKEVYKKIEEENKKLDKEYTDKDLEDELVRRFEALENSPQENKSKHDESCQENTCDGCGSQDVYDQVYGKRKRNKIKKK